MTVDVDGLVARLRAAGCVFAEDEAALLLEAAGDDAERLEAMASARAAGRPLEHVVGWAEFCGLRIAVGEGVFVPRPRTELVAAAVLELLPSQGGTFIELCCGAGPVATVVATRRSDVDSHAADIDPVAVGFARRNVEPLGGHVHEGDLYDALPSELRGRIDVLAANVPYVPSAEVALLPREAREHEPIATLDGGADGLDLLRLVAAGAADWLAPGGVMVSETSIGQAEAACDVLGACGLAATATVDHELDVTVVSGRRRPTAN